jgi:hypothetical protein
VHRVHHNHFFIVCDTIDAYNTIQLMTKKPGWFIGKSCQTQTQQSVNPWGGSERHSLGSGSRIIETRDPRIRSFLIMIHDRLRSPCQLDHLLGWGEASLSFPATHVIHVSIVAWLCVETNFISALTLFAPLFGQRPGYQLEKSMNAIVLWGPPTEVWLEFLAVSHHKSLK